MMKLFYTAISPDLDTITTLAGEINPETGWGLIGELECYGNG